MSRRVTRRTFLKASGVTAAAVATGGFAQAFIGDDEDPDRPLVPWFVPTPVLGQRVDEQVQGYVAVAPRVLRSGQQESVSVALFRSEGKVDVPAASTVAVSLLKDGATVAEGTGWVPGRGAVPLAVPALAAGEYTLRVAAKGFRQQAAIQVEDGTLVFVETDKPIYKPGQTLHIRVLALDPLLRPVAGEALVEALDAQGIKVFRKTVVVDDYGMGSVDLPLSSEPNLGVWKVQAILGERSSQVDVRVERYVLPKYEVRVEPRKAWVLARETISGVIAAEYSFGKPVNGEVEITAARYVGVWEEYAHVVGSMRDGRMTFEIPAVGYAAGSPAGGGLASVQLSVTVSEQATGYEETTTQLVTVANGPVVVRLIAEGSTFKPGLPFSILVNAETPDQQPVDAEVRLALNWQDANFNNARSETKTVSVTAGLGTLTVDPPAEAVSLYAEASSGDVLSSLTIPAGYSPRGAFIHVQQVDRGPFAVGDVATFRVAATRAEGNFFYEVLARGKVVFSDVSRGNEISLTLSPLMAPEARLLVYQIQPDGEVAADYLPFSVAGNYPQTVEVRLPDEVAPGDPVDAVVQTQGPARVGLVAVDRSVFILAENRLNLQQVFAELERLYGEPQAELHEVEPMMGWGDPYSARSLPGAQELFDEVGVIVLTNRTVPRGKELKSQFLRAVGDGAIPAAAEATSAMAGEDEAASAPYDGSGLAEPQRVRQFFPETWVWSELTTDDRGRATQALTAPDSITTWMFRAVALSKEHGLGIGEAQTRVFQPFFAQIDLPYAAIRGEELPAAVALYNYGTEEEEFTVELTPADWFDALDDLTKTVTIAPNEVGAVSFQIRPTTLGVQPLQVSARGRTLADALIKELIVEPEGIAREEVENVVLTPGNTLTADLSVPFDAVDGSGRAFLALTGNVLSQTIEGLEGLLQMPFGCGEQNMILFAPNVFVTRYLEETGQIKPEVLAKAELLMLTGYQREMIYRRGDGSFSAFGASDPEGSLWLTAFVLRTFAQARDIIFIDEMVLSSAADWIRSHANSDGSYDPVGFVHHTELLGGLNGRTALTAFVAVALHQSGDVSGAAAASRYLESQLDNTDDAYTLAILTYALALTGSGQAGAALDKLMTHAKESDEGLYWGDEVVVPLERSSFHPGPVSTAIETTGYATLALLELGENLDASRAVRWLASQRNAYGGYGSTQDTVVALQAMTAAATISRASIDATVSIRAGDIVQEWRIAGDTADILHVLQLPAGEQLQVETRGSGSVMGQIVRRYNLPAVDLTALPIFDLSVEYSAERVEVDDRISVIATVRFMPPEPIAAGMIVLDIAVPTGFAPVADTIDDLLAAEPKLKRWDQAGRKVIFYIEDMLPGESMTLTFEAKALYPVRAQPVASQVYAYYRPEWRGESLGGGMVVR